MSDLRQIYSDRKEKVLNQLAKDLETHLRGLLSTLDRIDRISCRAKGVDSFVAKGKTSEKGDSKYQEPLKQIQDQIGARIIVFYKSDVERVSREILRHFRSVEFKDLVPESEWEFGYFGRHYVLFVPSDVKDPKWPANQVPAFFELQIKTLFQHAWSEANHDLGYKAKGVEIASDSRRQLALASAQAWGSDQIFDELHQKVSASDAKVSKL